MISQAAAAWQWFNYYSREVQPGKQILRINLDETSVCLFQGDRKGTVFVHKKRLREDEPVQRIPRWKRRCCLTHIAVICDSPELQPLMPQVLVGNEATFLSSGLAALRAACPGNVRLVRQKSAWNNAGLCAWVVQLLALALRPHLHRLQPVLLLDAVRIHFAKAVLCACRAGGIWPLLVPARTTWLLQPLDTHSFLRYKAYLRDAYQRARVESGCADLSIQQFLMCVCDTIRHVLQGQDWANAFDKDGFGCRQSGLSTYAMRQLRLDAPPSAPETRPSDEQLKVCFPKRTNIPVSTLWRPFDPSPSVDSVAGARRLVRQLPRAAVPQVLGRTRLQTRIALANSAEAVAVPSGGAEATGIAVARAHRLPRAKAVAIGM